MRFIDFFSGIGGIRLGMEKAGHQCLGFCEFDKYARKSYKAMYNTKEGWENHDIRTVNSSDIPRADLWCFGFPCQDLSLAGKRKGLQEGKRSGLFYEIVRLLQGLRQEDKPKWLLCENVKGLLSAGGGFDFLRLLIELGQAGYSIEWQMLNSKDFGVPQNRERIFIIGHLGEECGREVFPIAGNDGTNSCELQEITKGVADAYRIYDSQGLARTLKSEGGGLGAKTGLYMEPAPNSKETTFIDLTANKPKTTEVARCLKARYDAGLTNFQADNSGILIREATAKGYSLAEEGDYINLGQIGSKTRRGRVGKQMANTLCCDDQQGVVVYDDYNNSARADQSTVGTLTTNCGASAPRNGQKLILEGAKVRIRKLTPRECWRLQGFPDSYFDKAQQAGVSNTQLYKQAGNAVTVNVAEAIGKKLAELEKESEGEE